MAVGDTITAARYNIIQARVAAVIGLGSGDEGYGQARTSSTAAVGATITAQDMTNLFTDMTKIRLHQSGSVPTEIASPSVGDTVEDSNSTSKVVVIITSEGGTTPTNCGLISVLTYCASIL
jgi:hypothetical protein